MTDPAAAPSPFWRFSLKFYGQPGVAPACLALQDRAGVDVNILLFLLWQASQGIALSQAEVGELESTFGQWRELTVVPLRAVRRALKEPPRAVAAAASEAFRTRVKAVELEAERLQQEAMFQLAASGRLGRRAASPDDAASASVTAYQAVLKPFPHDALATILAAFAKFDPPV